MIDISAMHRKFKDPRAFNRFLHSAGFRDAMAYLQTLGKGEDEVFRKTPAYRGSPSVTKVHPLIALEYLRWHDYNRYAKTITDKLLKEE